MFKRRMLRAKQRIHLIRVRKRPTMLESDISKLYPGQRRACKLFYFLLNSIRVGVHIFLFLQTSSSIFCGSRKVAFQTVSKEVIILRNE